MSDRVHRLLGLSATVVTVISSGHAVVAVEAAMAPEAAAMDRPRRGRP